jgi:hypothetical protein
MTPRPEIVLSLAGTGARDPLPIEEQFAALPDRVKWTLFHVLDQAAALSGSDWEQINLVAHLAAEYALAKGTCDVIRAAGTLARVVCEEPIPMEARP